MIKKKRLVVLAVLLQLLVSTAQAEDIDMVVKMAIAQKSLDLSIRDRSFSPSFNTFDIAVTGAMGRFYLTLDHDISIKDAVETDPNGLIFFSRSDSSLTLGYSIMDWLSIFTGFRTGETEANYSANNSSFGNTSEGYYIGLNGSHYFEKKGSLSLSLAIASLDGSVALSEPFVDTSVFLVGNPPPSEINGSAVGYSLGLSWSGKYSEDTNYSIGIKLQRYEFEDDIVFGGLDLSYDENFNTISIGLTHFFQ